MKRTTYGPNALQRRDSFKTDELAYESNRGCGFLFGMIFVLVGFGSLVAAALMMLSQQAGAGGVAGGAIAALVGLVFILAGGLFAFTHSGITFNRKTRTIYKWWTLFSIKRDETHRFDDFERLRFFREETRDSDGDTQVSYPVKLWRAAGTPLDIDSYSKEEGARAMAEEIGKFCGFAVENAVGVQPVIRQPGELDENLRQRALRKGVPALTPPPAPMRSSYAAHGNSISVEIPAPPFSVLYFLPAAAAMVFAVMVSAFLLLPALSTGSGGLFFPVGVIGFFVILPIGGTLLYARRQRGRTCSVSADKDLLRVAFAGKPAEEIPAGELEELSVEQSTDRAAEWLGTNLTIVARSDKYTMRFGQGLSKEELQWLCVLLERAIVAEL